MCHVFRCDIPPLTIANTLRDACKKVLIERELQQNPTRPVDINGRTSLAARPTNLPTEHRRFHRNGQTLVSKYNKLKKDLLLLSLKNIQKYSKNNNLR